MSEISHELRLLEAMLFAAAEPVEEAALARRLPEGTDVPALLSQLAARYTDGGVNLVQLAGKWIFRTSPDLAPFMRVEDTVVRKLSRAAVETLAIIAYHQPVTRAEIEEIRGVALSKGTLDVLFECGWIRPAGRRQTPGKPVTWATTEAFLTHFGLGSLNDLPGVDELKAAGLLDSRPAAVVYGQIGSGSASAEAEESHPADTEEEPLPPLDPEEPDRAVE